MTEMRYQYGSQIGIVRAGLLVVLEQETPEQLIAEVWDLLATNPTLDDVFGRLTAAFDQPIHGMPSFGLIAFSAELHVILRGPLHLTTAPGPAGCHISGNEVSRWSERLLPLQDFTLTAGEAEAGRSGQAWYPVEEAVVRFGSMRLLSSGRPDAAVVLEPGVQELPAHSRVHEEDPAETDDESATKMPPLEPDVSESPIIPVAQPLQRQKLGEEAQGTGGEGDEGYDHLWFTDVARSAEAAAVREPDNGPGIEFAEPRPRAEMPTASVMPPPAFQSEPPPHPAPAAVVPVTGLIDYVPWAPEGVREPLHGVAQPHLSTAPRQEAADAEDEYEDTVIAAPRAGGSDSGESAAPALSAGSILVLGRLCGSGHANPPEHAECSSCGGPLTGEPRDVPRPSLGRVRVSTGETIDLVRSLVIGRRPAVSRVQGTDMPKLITLAKAGREVSGSHLEVRLEGWHVIMRDLKSTNGTVLVRDGQSPRRLDQGEDTMLVSGDAVELGGAVTLAFEELR